MEPDIEALRTAISIITSLGHQSESGNDVAIALAQEAMTKPDFHPDLVMLALGQLAHDFALLFAMERGITPEEVIRNTALRLEARH